MDIGWCPGALYVILVRGRRSELRGAPAPLPTPTRATLEGRATLALILHCGCAAYLDLKFYVKFEITSAKHFGTASIRLMQI